MPAERPGDGGEHDVVDGAADLVLDRLQVAQLGPHPGEATVRTDRPVVEAARRRIDAGPGHGPDADGRLAGTLEQAPRAADGGTGRAHDLAGDRGALEEGLAE